MEMANAAQAAERRRAMVLVGCMVLIWGCNWPVNKVILTHIGPFWFASVRMGLGAATLFLVQAFRSDGVKLPARADLPIVFSIGLVQMAAMLTLMNLGLTSVAAGRSAILSYTTPLWVVPGAMLILGERLHLVKAMALLLGLAGVAFMFNPLGFDWSDHKAIVGNGYLLAAAVLWAGTTIHVRAHRWRGTPLALAPWQMLAGFVPMLVLSRWVEGPAPHIGFSWSVVLLALYTGPVITAFPFWAFVTIARTLPALTTSLTLLLVPVVGLLSSAAALSEPLDVTTVVGLLLIVSAVAAVSLADAGWFAKS